jgi:hypothetical protein
MDVADDSCRDMSGLLEQVIIIVFSLHLGEPQVLDLAMLSFISLSYIVLHHDFQFLCLTAFIEFISGWQSCDAMTGCSGFYFFLGIFMFFLVFSFSSWVHGVSYRFHALKISLLPFIIGSRMWIDNQGYFKASLLRSLFLGSK